MSAINSVRVEVDCTAGLTNIYTVPPTKTLVISALVLSAGSFATSGNITWTIRIAWGLTHNIGGNSQGILYGKGLLVRENETIEVSALGTWTKSALLCGELVDQV